MKNIVVLDGFTLNPGDLSWESLRELGNVTLYDRTDPADTISRIGDAEFIFTNKTMVDKKVIESCPQLKYIGVLATGYNVVDLDAASKRGISVTNAPNYSTPSVAQFVFALLLEICHHAGSHSESVYAGDWSRSQDFCYWNYPLIELVGKTMGIIGFGRIGRATAALAQAFGMQVLVYAPRPKPEFEKPGISFASFDRVLAEADVISLHCPLTDETSGIINQTSISKMKKDVIIINTSRGPLVVEKDLAAALNSGRVFAAGVDVVSSEPIKKDNPLLGAKNCIITPHIAWGPKEARQRLMDIVVQNLRDFISGTPKNVVNKP